MLNDLPLIYWDSCVPLAYINGEMERLPNLEGLMQQSGKDHQLITSVYSKVEVAFAKIEQDKKALSGEIEVKINALWIPGSPIQLVELFDTIMDKALRLKRKAIEKGWQLKPGDAIHLATADHLKVFEFHTYDDKLDKFRTLTDAQFNITRPRANQPVMVLEKQEATNDPKTESASAQAGEIASPDPLRGGSGGLTEGQAATEGKISAETAGKAKAENEEIAPPADPKGKYLGLSKG